MHPNDIYKYTYLQNMQVIQEIGEFRNRRAQQRRPKDSVFTVAVLPRSTVVVGDSHGTIGIWSYARQNQQAKLEKPRRVRKIIGHSHWIDCSVVINPQLKLLATGSKGDLTSIRVWNLNEGLCLATLKGHKQTISCLTTLGESIASGSYDGTIIVWNWRKSEQQFQLEGHGFPVLTLTKDATEAYLISGGDDYRIKIWSVADRACVNVITYHLGSVHSLCFSQDNMLISGSASGELCGWDFKALLSPGSVKPMIKFEGHSETITSITVMRDKGYVLTVSQDRSIKLWDSSTGGLVSEVKKAHEDVITCLSYCEEDKVFYSGDWKGLVKKWRLRN